MNQERRRGAPRSGQIPILALSVEETAESVGLAYKTTLRLIQRGLIGATQVGQTWVVPVTEIQKWLDKAVAERAAELQAAA